MLNLIIPSSYIKEIEHSRLAVAFRVTLAALDLDANSSTTLRLTNNRVIRQYNHAWLGINAPTDVLSFENSYIDPETGEHYLGDIIISFEKARQQAKAGGHSLYHEVEMLFVHGLLHLAGYDHDQRDNLTKMSSMQDFILEKTHNPLKNSIQSAEK